MPDYTDLQVTVEVANVSLLATQRLSNSTPSGIGSGTRQTLEKATLHELEPFCKRSMVDSLAGSMAKRLCRATDEKNPDPLHPSDLEQSIWVVFKNQWEKLPQGEYPMTLSFSLRVPVRFNVAVLHEPFTYCLPHADIEHLFQFNRRDKLELMIRMDVTTRLIPTYPNDEDFWAWFKNRVE